MARDDHKGSGQLRVLSASVIGAGLALFGITAYVQLRDMEHSAIYQENPAPPADLAQTEAARSAAEKRLADAMSQQIANWPTNSIPKRTDSETNTPDTTIVARAEPQAAPPSPPLAAPPPAGMGAAEQDALLDRVSGLLKQGDIGAARAVLNRLVRENNAKAAYMLAQSYDPQVLKQGKVVGMRADPALARDLYQKALRGGVTEAKAALDALPPP